MMNNDSESEEKKVTSLDDYRNLAEATMIGLTGLDIPCGGNCGSLAELALIARDPKDPAEQGITLFAGWDAWTFLPCCQRCYKQRRRQLLSPHLAPIPPIDDDERQK